MRTRSIEERDRAWLKANLQAIESSNAWVEKHGLPLSRYRLFGAESTGSADIGDKR